MTPIPLLNSSVVRNLLTPSFFPDGEDGGYSDTFCFFSR
jgi:hypothetical protein